MAHRTLTTRDIILCGLVAVFVLIVAMHGVKAPNAIVHPDEGLHLSCFDYFLHHFWPPAANSSAIIPSLKSSSWGVSYLNAYDVVYFIAGHTAGHLVSLFGSPVGAARAFQLALLAILLLCAMRRERWAILLVPVLLSPQIWYIFAYFNGDAFSFFLSAIAVMLASDSEGNLGAFLQRVKPFNWQTLAFALCVGLLLVSKLNYVPVVFGIFLALGVRYLGASWLELLYAIVAAATAGIAVSLGAWPDPVVIVVRRVLLISALLAGALFLCSVLLRVLKQPALRPVLLRFLTVALVAGCFAAPRVVDDLWLNGLPSSKSVTVLNMTESYAEDAFKPSMAGTPAAFVGLRFAQKGVTLRDMFWSRGWLVDSLKSAFGTYGYMNVWASNAYYWITISVFTLLIGLAAIFYASRFGGVGRKIVFVSFGTCFLILISSMLFSWLEGFQSQGRYLLPMLPVFGLFLGPALVVAPRRVFNPLLVVLLALGLYSFACIGIGGVAALP